MQDYIQDVNESNFKDQIKKGQEEVQKKFDFYDDTYALLERRLAASKITRKEFTDKIGILFRDPTIWSYANLRDKQLKPLKLYYFQDKIMNDLHPYIHTTAANQIGKTWGPGVIKSLHHSLYTNSASVMLISKKETQAKGILDEIKWMLKRAKIDWLDFIKDEVDNRFELHLQSPDKKGTSVIRVFSPTDRILSFPATLIIMDETGFWKDYEGLSPTRYYHQMVEPRTNETVNWEHPFLTMGQIISITNPNGQSGFAWWLRNNPEFHQYRYNWLAKPPNAKKYDKYLHKKNTIPAVEFASTYAAQYVSPSAGFITLEQYERFAKYDVEGKGLSIPQGAIIYLGGDFAAQEPNTRNTDWNVLYGVTQVKNKDYPEYPRIKVIYKKEFGPGTPRNEIYEEIEKIKNLKDVTIAKFAYDRVGVADSIKRDLVGRGTLYEDQVEVLSYSLQNKSDIYLNFQALFEQDMIEGTEIPELKEQLLALKVEKPPGSVHIKVHHKTDGVKDDHPDALANACFVARQPHTEPSIEFVEVKRGGIEEPDFTKKTVICPDCEKEGKDGYHKKKAEYNFQRIKCEDHATVSA